MKRSELGFAEGFLSTRGQIARNQGKTMIEPIKTYGDISKIIKSGKKVAVTNHYGNTRTYYIDDNGVPRDQHNQSKPSIFIGFDDENTVEIEPTSRVEIF